LTETRTLADQRRRDSRPGSSDPSAGGSQGHFADLRHRPGHACSQRGTPGGQAAQTDRRASCRLQAEMTYRPGRPQQRFWSTALLGRVPRVQDQRGASQQRLIRASSLPLRIYMQAGRVSRGCTAVWRTSRKQRWRINERHQAGLPSARSMICPEVRERPAAYPALKGSVPMAAAGRHGIGSFASIEAWAGSRPTT